MEAKRGNVKQMTICCNTEGAIYKGFFNNAYMHYRVLVHLCPYLVALSEDCTDCPQAHRYGHVATQAEHKEERVGKYYKLLIK